MPGTPQERELAAHLDGSLRYAFEGIEERERHDAYIAAIHVHDEDALTPEVVPFFNTEQRVAHVFTPEWERERIFGWHEYPPVDRDEARWGIGFWCPVGGDVACDAATRSKVESWARSLDLWFEEPEPWDADEWDAVYQPMVAALHDRFRELCGSIVSKMHDDGWVEGTFGRTIPIVVLDLFLEEPERALATRVNPPGTLSGFSGYLEELGRRYSAMGDAWQTWKSAP